MATAYGSVQDGLDHETLSLLVRLQLEDLENMTQTNKGKYPDGRPPDSKLAAELYGEELMRLSSFLQDMNMARSLSAAVGLDGEIIRIFETEERRAVADRALAVAAASGQGNVCLSSTENSVPDAPPSLDNEMIEKLEALFVTQGTQSTGKPHNGDGYEHQGKDTVNLSAESSKWAASRPTGKTAGSLRQDCISCGDSVAFCDIARAPCGHQYCRDCLKDLVQASLTDETLFPPRCCKTPIPIEENRVFLPQPLVREFLEKRTELGTPNRTYCSRSTCSAFIRQDNVVGDVASCDTCGTKTCSICKSAAHDGDCPEDESIQQVLEIARANNWQRCYSCRSVVELQLGCNHIRYCISNPLQSDLSINLRLG